MLKLSKLSDLIGKVLVEAKAMGHSEIIFVTADGKRYKLYHEQDCCEDVYIESIVGDLQDLVGSPLLIAEEASSYETPAGLVASTDESFTWTFYKFATVKGYVDIRWYGSSNGYYSENVDFCEES